MCIQNLINTARAPQVLTSTCSGQRYRVMSSRPAVIVGRARRKPSVRERSKGASCPSVWTRLEGSIMMTVENKLDMPESRG